MKNTYLNPAPRKLDIFAIVSIFFEGTLKQFFWLFFGFGSLLFWIIGSQADMSFLFYYGDIERSDGIIQHIEQTNYYSNDEAVYKYFYSFTDKEGVFREDVSYSTSDYLDVETSVTVEYPEGKPYLSRIKGFRRSPFGPFGIIIIIFPGIALVFLYFSIRKSFKRLKLLKNGELAFGVLKRREATNTRINNKTVYKLTFQFLTKNDENIRFIEKTHRTDLIKDNDDEPIIYNSLNPKEAVHFYLINTIMIYNGRFVSKSSVTALLSLIIPLLVIVENLLFIIFKVLR